MFFFIKTELFPHCVLLEHYYSVDFPWWFDRFFLRLPILKSNWKNSWNLSVKKVTLLIWQIFFASAKESVLKNVSKTFKSNWRLNAWMDPVHFFSIVQFLFDSLQVKLLSPWMAWFNSKVDDLNFVLNHKSKLVNIVANWGHSRWKGLILQKIE